jgi:hypothetical protein
LYCNAPRPHIAFFCRTLKVTSDKVLERMRGTGGVVLKTSLDHAKERALREAIAGVAKQPEDHDGMDVREIRTVTPPPYPHGCSGDRV